ncbi:outer membrane beta-barrel protein [Pedobacter gandavensis]|uniref:Outer membrane beta-barrel protein n=1 Tax=Pedobacter gandavensis TaxID=2679963 RepID=A0ABR6F1D9_9SPHI|nr:outer membrane beta-barrel protein [Pedobacter gandavensis]MBB2151350.1 outer membrane beta-barrel protein [Pedobacter gandavensis]
MKILSIRLFPFLISCILCLFTLNAHAQYKISGKVLDQGKMPVPFATITLKKLVADSAAKRTVLTDVNGLFVIQETQSGKFMLSISSIGFLTFVQELNLENKKEVWNDIVLKDDQQQLAGVTIKGAKPLIQQKTDRTVMNVAGSVLASGNNLYGILAIAPSVELINNKLTMNGKSNVLILLNGKKLPNTNLETVLASIPGTQIDYIEFIHNPSAKYDADASGGVIEIHTKKNTDLGWMAGISGNVSQGYRTAGGINTDLRWGNRKLDLTVSGGYNNRGQIQRGYVKRELFQGKEHIGDFNQTVDLSSGKGKDKNLSGSLNYQLGKNDLLGVDISLISANLNGLGNINATINERNAISQSKTFNDAFIQIDLSNYNIFYKKTLDSLGSNLMLSANYALFTSTQKQEFHQNLTEPNGTEKKYMLRNDAAATYNIYTGTADYTKNFNKASKLETGLKYTFTDNQSKQSAEVFKDGNWTPSGDALNELGYQESIFAGYVNFNQQLGSFSLQMGLRAENSTYSVVRGIDSSYFNLFPNVRLDYKLNQDYTSSISYAKNINRPAYESLIPYELFIDNYTSIRGNAFLRPEYAHTFSWNQLYKKYSLNLAYTRRADAISDFISYDEKQLRFIETKGNFLAQEMFSGTFAFPIKMTSWWSMNNRAALYYQIVKSPAAFDPHGVQRRSKANVTLSSMNSFKMGEGLAAEISAYYSSASIYSIYDMSAFSNVSMGISKSIFKDQASIKLDASDIFYNNYRLARTNTAPLITEGLTKNDTRRIRLSFRYTFDKNTKVKKARIKSDGNSTELNRLSL